MEELTLAVRAELIAIGLAPTALVGLLGWLFREKWKQMLSRSLGLNLEREKARLLRELEAYRVSLVAETERHKASVEVKKVIALRQATAEYDALVAFHDLLRSTTTTVCTRAELVPRMPFDDARRSKEFTVAFNAVDELGKAAGRASRFLRVEDADSSGFLVRLSSVIGTHFMGQDAEPLPSEAKQEIFSACALLTAQIKVRIDELSLLATASVAD